MNQSYMGNPNWNFWNGNAPTQPQPASQPSNYGYYQPQQFRPNNLPGRIVNSPDEITPNDVLMDGSVSIFPILDKNNPSEYPAILAKAWNQNGTINTVVYIPQKSERPTLDSENLDVFSTILSRLDSIEKSLNRRQNYKPHPKKKVTADESK